MQKERVKLVNAANNDDSKKGKETEGNRRASSQFVIFSNFPAVVASIAPGVSQYDCRGVKFILRTYTQNK